ncbi:MAG: histidine kinase [Burkholderiales bacterium]|nr:histidine kinase [Burkholderiales bacterium]
MMTPTRLPSLWALKMGRPESWLQVVLLLGFYYLCGVLVYGALLWFDPWFSRRCNRHLVSRIVFGQLLLLSEILMLTYLLYLQLFPFLFGRQANSLGLWVIFYQATMASFLVYGWLLVVRTNQNNRQQALRLHVETEALATSLHRTELALLEAQIEPHFLFNTLALIKRQYRHDTEAADKVMLALLHYLERAGPALRQADWNLAQELDLVARYLDILQHRFGERLRYQITQAEGSGQAKIPALVLATLVENAVRHGITPKAEGGTITITTHLAHKILHITICDDGVGLRQTSGNGLGLSTVRARLRSAYSDAANVLVEPNVPCGVRVSITLPWKTENHVERIA